MQWPERSDVTAQTTFLFFDEHAPADSIGSAQAGVSSTRRTNRFLPGICDLCDWRHTRISADCHKTHKITQNSPEITHILHVLTQIRPRAQQRHHCPPHKSILGSITAICEAGAPSSTCQFANLRPAMHATMPMRYRILSSDTDSSPTTMPYTTVIAAPIPTQIK